MHKLMIDLETRSDADITKTGVYRYADSPYFDILLFAYSVDDAPVKVIDLASGESLPDDILHALTDDSVTKHSFNASFERVCLSVWLKRNYPDIFHSYSIPQDSVGNYLSPDSWHCSMAASAYLGLPLTLAGVGSVLKLEQQKMTEGKALIKYFCVPYAYDGDKPLFHVPSDAPDKWAVFKAYNKRDVETEIGIERKISRFPVPYFVWKEYHLDQEINDCGIQQCEMRSARMAVQEECSSSTVQIVQVGKQEGLYNCKIYRRIIFPIWNRHEILFFPAIWTLWNFSMRIFPTHFHSLSAQHLYRKQAINSS